MPKKLTKKINDLEKHIVDIKPKGRVRVVIDDPSELALYQKQEEILKSNLAKLHRAMQQLKENPEAYSEREEEPLMLSGQEEMIVMRALSLKMQRFFEIADDFVGFAIHKNDPEKKREFYWRLDWFLSDLTKKSLYEGTDFKGISSAKRKEMEELLFPEKKFGWLTKKSWQHYIDKRVMRIYQEHLMREEKQKQPKQNTL